MASYRFSASVISRSTGRSATAAAAYRAAALIECDRYGEAHDYTRKQGVLHSEIIAPDNAPDWMHDRARLWNAVEAAEKRKDAQLAREVQLSLPAELDDDMRRELVRAFVRDQFVSVGMVADIAIHAPHRDGDERNHHAHIMLTMREIEAGAFGKKARAWNDSAKLEHWREQWATYQNREFERLGLSVRVDHRSHEARGIDHEPEQHEGVAATALKRKRQQSDRAAENEARRDRNDERTRHHVEALKELAKIAAERERFESWAHERTAMLEAAQGLSRLDLTRRQESQRDALEADLRAYYEPHLATVTQAATAAQSRLAARGVMATLRRAFTGQRDRAKLDELQATIRDTHTRMQESRARLVKAQGVEMARLAQVQEQRRAEQHEGIQRAAERKAQSLADRAREAQKAMQQREPETREQQPAAGAPLAERLRLAQQRAVSDQTRDREQQATQEPQHERGKDYDREL